MYAPGEDVTFTFVVKNTSTEEPVTITSLSDSVYGTLAGDADCKVGTVLAAGASCDFSFTESVTADHTNTFTAKAVDNDGSEATDAATASVDVIDPQITIVKVTFDGTASGDGINILTGEPISWKYTVSNAGDVPLSNVSVTDNKGVTVTCPKTTLAVGESMDCSAAGNAITGFYSNTGSVSAKHTDLDGDIANRSASDTSSYFGADPQITITKVTVFGPRSGDGMVIVAGQPVVWRYTVTNVGNVPLSSVTVTDSKTGVTPIYKSGDANGDGKLDLTETWIFEAAGTAVAGNYSNTGTAKGSYTDSAGHSRTDTASDGSSYFGAQPSQLTDTSWCPLVNNQFRLLYRLEALPNIYRLGGSNPGQFYMNAFYSGAPGSTFTMNIQIPYPFMTQEGAGNPIQVHDGTSLSGGCYVPNPRCLATPSPRKR